MGSRLYLSNFSSIETYQQYSRRSGLNSWDVRLKITLLLLVSALNVILAYSWLSLGLWLLGLGLAGYSRVPLRLFAFFFLAPAWATLLVMAGFAVGFGSDKLLQLGPFVVYRQGLRLALSAGTRVACEMTWMGVIFITTPINRILEGLAWCRFPRVLLETLALTYRYIFLLCDEFQRMWIAARSRGGADSPDKRLRSLGLIVAQVFLRAYDRSQRIQAAIAARGGE